MGDKAALICWRETRQSVLYRLGFVGQRQESLKVRTCASATRTDIVDEPTSSGLSPQTAESNRLDMSR